MLNRSPFPRSNLRVLSICIPRVAGLFNIQSALDRVADPFPVAVNPILPLTLPFPLPPRKGVGESIEHLVDSVPAKGAKKREKKG